MRNKPVTPHMHGVIDYIFSGMQVAGPVALRLPGDVKKTYAALGLGFMAINALTNTPAGLCKLLSMKQHQAADITFLSGLTLLTALPMVRTKKKALAFHLGFLALAVTHYILSDYTD